MKTWPDLGIVVVGTGDDSKAFKAQVDNLELTEHLHMAGDMEHEAFLTLLSRSDVLLRTLVTDGVSATVLEALSLGTPVVASENGTRPPSVVTYHANDPQDMARKIAYAFENIDEIAASIITPQTADTTRSEIDLILGVAVDE